MGCRVEPDTTSIEDSLHIVFEGLEVRQYHLDKLRFLFNAQRVVVKEDDELIEASGEISGQLESILWEEQPK